MASLRTLEKQASKQVLMALIKAAETAEACPGEPLPASAVNTLAAAYAILPIEE